MSVKYDWQCNFLAFFLYSKNNLTVFVFSKVPDGKKFFEGECIPDWDNIEKLFTDMNDDLYPHAWRGAVVCFVFGLALMVITDLFALMVSIPSISQMCKFKSERCF